MTRTARQIAAASIAALIAVAAIIAADIAAPAPTQAQSDEQSSGKIIARRTADDRTEFGWQTPSGARVFPRQRYFPAAAAATLDRWLTSSPVEVEGAEIGRINARLRAGGRIEFAFTPTDGARILPPSRYFPHNARIGRWLSSTTITIGTPAATSGYVAVSAGEGHTCAIRAGSGAIECWGANEAYRYDEEAEENQLIETGQATPPDGRYTAISAGQFHNCAIRSTGALECWGANDDGQSDAPAGSFSAVSAGRVHTCAIRESDDAIECWGANASGQAAPPAGKFRAVSADQLHTCAIHDDRMIECWGNNYWYREIDDAPEGSFSTISASTFYSCTIQASEGAVECWGPHAERIQPPEGSYIAVSVGSFHTCAIRSTGALECWGVNNGYGQTDAPTGRFRAVSAGGYHTCAIRASDGAIECWGWNQYGQATPPTE